MLMLSMLHGLLSQVLSPPHLHTAVLLTTAGELVSFASDPVRPKDEIRIIVGFCGEVWQETREEGYGLVDSELGRLVVLPVDDSSGGSGKPYSDEHQPLMLLVLNATDVADWDELQKQGTALATHLAKSLGRFREHITMGKSIPSTTAAVSPAPLRP